MSSSDTIYVGDPICSFDGYIKSLYIAYDGNIIQQGSFTSWFFLMIFLGPCSNDCTLSSGSDNANYMCLSCWPASNKFVYNSVCTINYPSGFGSDFTGSYCEIAKYINPAGDCISI